MSEVVTGGLAAATVGTCAVMVGAVVGAAYLAYRGVMWLSEQAQKEVERLEQELPDPPTQVTTLEARELFARTYQAVRAKAAKHPALRSHAEAVGRLLALRRSPLGAFVTKAEWDRVALPLLSQRSFSTLLEKAATRLTQTTALSAARAIVEVASQVGFPHQRLQFQGGGRQTLVLGDSEGRALVAEVLEAKDGARVNLDLTGFGDASCHGVMDRVLSGLAAKGIHLRGAVCRSHYRREGCLDLAVDSSRRGAGRGVPIRKDRDGSDVDRRRRRLQPERTLVRFKG